MSSHSVEANLRTSFMEAVKRRRTCYGLGKEQIVEQARIVDIVKDAVKYAPSAFNSQSARAVVLFGQDSDRLWSLTARTLQKIVPADRFAETQQRIDGFAAGYGTVLFFEDQAVVRKLQDQFPTFADQFPVWSNQSAGMLQYIVWTALELEGLGASLQHYNPLIDDEVAREWQLPADWKLIAQMPFGKPTFQPGEKEFMPLEGRVKVFSA